MGDSGEPSEDRKISIFLITKLLWNIAKLRKFFANLTKFFANLFKNKKINRIFY